MQENCQEKFIVPPRGYVNELAKLSGSCRKTVSRALQQNAQGVKADKIRKLYMKKYGRAID